MTLTPAEGCSTLPTLIVKLCRKFHVFPNERTTILSQADDLQVLQYCLAFHNHKVSNDFIADPKEVLEMFENLRQFNIKKIEQAIEKYNVSAFGENCSDCSAGSMLSGADGVPVSLEDSTVGPDVSNELEMADKNREAHVFGIYQEYKKNSNHWSVLDVFLHFVQVITDCQADLRLALKTNAEIDDLELDVTEFISVQAKILDVLKSMKEPASQPMKVASVDDALSNVPSTLPISPSIIKTPSSPRQSTSPVPNEVPSTPTNTQVLRQSTSPVPNEVPSTPTNTQVLRQSTSPVPNEVPSTPTNTQVLRQSTSPVPNEVPSTPTNTQVLCSHSQSISPANILPRTPYSPSQRKELQKLLVQDIFRSYLHLLVNSRSQLAFARVFNIPERELDHMAFTHLKHEASRSGLSLYQTLSSYMRRIHLGGSGYAPSQDNPLMQYVKGLGMLLDLTQKLQTVVEEELDLQSACRRIVNIIKVNLSRCKSGKFPRTLVDPEADIILNKLLAAKQELEKCKESSPVRPINSGGSVLGRQCMRVIQAFLDQSALSISELDHHLMSDIQISSQSPTRIPCLLTQFRSPAIVDLDSDQPEVSTSNFKRTTNLCKKQFVSCALYLETDKIPDELMMSQATLSTIDVIPSKTIVQSGEKGTLDNKSSFTHNSNSLPLLGKVTKLKGNKRSHMAVAGQENLVTVPALAEEVKSKQQNTALSSPKSSKSGAAQFKKGNPKSSCRRRLMPQVKGQAKITGFFRM
ncbi:PCNA-interacting partner-like [Biomphalaria glabrata]|uniref:PCNA-interacting partner n=1 Tax=Biomphalaria glabrata TaxID=6526 RepID=A0A9W3AIP5_BIOGL|nr:PCNA-interacting partner-like [Biomphalaria glabrata]XP_055886999.1 PCNA-interacting partner-like [Biomphalaria glabrata]